MDEFERFVKDRLIVEGEKRPICPFFGPEKVGYCGAAYSNYCYRCDESRGEFESKIKKGGNLK